MMGKKRERRKGGKGAMKGEGQVFLVAKKVPREGGTGWA
jgi:hypothetical protein